MVAPPFQLGIIKYLDNKNATLSDHKVLNKVIIKISPLYAWPSNRALMMLRRVLSIFCIIFPCLALSWADSHAISSASLSRAPVGFYHRRTAFGDVESASSLGGAPVGVYGKRHHESVPHPIPFPRPIPYPPIVVPQYRRQRPYIPPTLPIYGSHQNWRPHPPRKGQHPRPGVHGRLLGAGGLAGLNLGGLLGGLTG